MSLTFVWLGALAMLASYLVVSAVLAAAIALAASAVDLASAVRRARRRSARLFAACVAPTAGGLLAAFGFVLPAWLALEPRGTQEQASPLIIVLAAAGAAVALAGLRRAIVEHRRTARAVAAWVRAGQPAPVPGLAVPALRVEHGFPLAAITGIWRPRLLLGAQVVEALTPAELRAVAAHESGHLVAGDVLKRLLLRACPDPLPWLRARARLEQCWEQASEAAADEFAARHVSRVVLAKALVKIAGLVPPGSRLTLGTPAFAAGPVAARVLDLLADDDRAVPAATRPAVRALPLLLVAAAASAWLLSLPFVLPRTHALVEALVNAFA
jgi:Zn-dependent protease with chaperone function